ncbi:MAG: riboflavin biosynthesis protein RibF [Clostridia bacterium]|nr:riboflavin biosynthesis protein RibF [Clostridia bacterium]
MPEYAVALGTFDGLHSGHIAVLQNILNKGLTPLVLTFDSPPKINKRSNLIMTPEDKISVLEVLGAKVEVMDFNKVKDMSPIDFLSFVVDKHSPKIIATGYDFRFGKGAEGDTKTLYDFCEARGIEYKCTDAVLMDGKPVSSTAIREAISAGDIKKANTMLNNYFSFAGKVRHGDERGRTIGFPTVNIAYPTELVVPKFGVYASFTEFRGEIYKSVTYIGVRPTFKTDFVISETNIIGFASDVYRKKIRIHLVDFIRGETAFAGLEELKAAISNDKKMAELLLNNASMY